MDGLEDFVDMILWELSRSGGGGRGLSGAESSVFELLEAESRGSRFGAADGEFALSNGSGVLIRDLSRFLDAGLSWRFPKPATKFPRLVFLP